jgi:hypothetical protein
MRPADGAAVARSRAWVLTGATQFTVAFLRSNTERSPGLRTADQLVALACAVGGPALPGSPVKEKAH